MTTQLARYDAARTALQIASSVDEVKDIRDKAEAMAAYARQAQDTDLIKWATEIKVRAERKAGQMLTEMPKATGTKAQLAGRSSGGHIVVPPENVAKTLSEIGVTKNESSRWQKLAAVPDEQFEQAVTAAKEVAGEVTTAAMLRAAKAADEQRAPKERKSKPAMVSEERAAEQKPAEEDPPEYTALDEAHDTIRWLQDALALANSGHLSEEDREQASNLIASLREENRILTLKLAAVTASRDQYQTENGELKKQIARQRREIDKLAGTRTA